MTLIYQHVTEKTKIILGSGSLLRDVEVIRGGATLGRVLFTHDPAVLVTGNDVRIEHCRFERS